MEQRPDSPTSQPKPESSSDVAKVVGAGTSAPTEEPADRSGRVGALMDQIFEEHAETFRKLAE